MKIAVSSSGNDLDSQIDPRFGRCAYFLIVDVDDMSFEAFENESIALGGGAGIQSAQFVASKGAKALITGNCGPNAVQALSAAGVKIFVGQSGTVREAVESYKDNSLASTSEANVADHYGMGGGAGTGRGMGMGGGRGMGRGMGMGGGRGMGRGMGMGGGAGMGRGMDMSGWNDPNSVGSSDLPKGQELNSLKDQASDLMKQMEEIQARIKRLEKK